MGFIIFFGRKKEFHIVTLKKFGNHRAANLILYLALKKKNSGLTKSAVIDFMCPELIFGPNTLSLLSFPFQLKVTLPFQ